MKKIFSAICIAVNFMLIAISMGFAVVQPSTRLMSIVIAIVAVLGTYCSARSFYKDECCKKIGHHNAMMVTLMVIIAAVVFNLMNYGVHWLALNL